MVNVISLVFELVRNVWCIDELSVQSAWWKAHTFDAVAPFSLNGKCILTHSCPLRCVWTKCRCNCLVININSIHSMLSTIAANDVFPLQSQSAIESNSKCQHFFPHGPQIWRKKSATQISTWCAEGLQLNIVAIYAHDSKNAVQSFRCECQ